MSWDAAEAKRLVAELREHDYSLRSPHWAISRLRNSTNAIAEQLEAADAEIERLTLATLSVPSIHGSTIQEITAERDSLRHQLEAAQREKAETTTAMITADRNLAAAQQRIAELEAECEDMRKLAQGRSSELSDATAALRAIAPVYADYQRLIGAAMGRPSHRPDVAVDPRILSTARARLTQDLLAVIEAVGK